MFHFSITIKDMSAIFKRDPIIQNGGLIPGELKIIFFLTSNIYGFIENLGILLVLNETIGCVLCDNFVVCEIICKGNDQI